MASISVSKKSGENLVKMVNIHKWFGKVHVLRGVDFEIKHSEIVGLVGDNGAGKSTLIKVLSGFHPSDEGEIYFEGKKISINSSLKARRLGIETVYQEQALATHMSIARNIFMGREPVKSLGFLHKKIMNKESMKALESLELHLRSPDILVAMLSGGERQGVAIARALHFKAKLVILDEPTIALSIKEAKQVLEFIKQLRKEGIAAIVITHNLYHVFPVAERFVILNRGETAANVKKEDTSIKKLSELIVREPSTDKVISK